MNSKIANLVSAQPRGTGELTIPSRRSLGA